MHWYSGCGAGVKIEWSNQHLIAPAPSARSPLPVSALTALRASRAYHPPQRTAHTSPSTANSHNVGFATRHGWLSFLEGKALT
jgi:hypothetical protein